MCPTQAKERTQALTDLLRRGLAIGQALHAALVDLDLAAFDRACLDLDAWCKDVPPHLSDLEDLHESAGLADGRRAGDQPGSGAPGG